MPDGVEQVGLAQSGVAVDEERVVGLRRSLGHRDRCGVGEAVRRADDEVVEVVLRVEPRLGPAARARGVDLARHEGCLDVLAGCGALLHRFLDGFGVLRHVRVDARLGRHVRVHRDGEVRDRVVTDAGDGLGDRDAYPLLEHAAGQVVGDLEVQGAGEDALRFDQVEEPVELRRDAGVFAEDSEYG